MSSEGDGRGGFAANKIRIMVTADDRAIVEAQRLNGGVIVSFADGTCAIFSAELLYATLPLAERVAGGDEPGRKHGPAACDWFVTALGGLER